MPGRRTSTTDIPLAAAERVVLILIAMQLVLLPWVFGGTSTLMQVTSFILSAAAFGFALRARSDAQITFRGRGTVLGRLLRFPFFWLGVAYATVVVVQGFNPAWQFRAGAGGWNLQGVSHAGWLPQGVRGAPFAMVNVWRVLLIHGSLWLLGCALWLGVTRRRTVRTLLAVVAVNGALVASVFLVQRLTGATRLLWLWDAPSYFVAGFVYKNHAGAFFNLVLAACLGLAWWHSARAERLAAKSHPGVLFVFLAVLVYAAQLFTYARAATLLSTVILLAAAVAFAIRLFVSPKRHVPIGVLAATMVLGVGFVGVCVVSLDLSRVWERFGRLLHEDVAISVTARELSRQATLDMAQAQPVWGHGTGSFRFVFPLYQQRYPMIFQNGGRLFWEHAHNDYVELLAENGLAGALAVAALASVAVVALWRARIVTQPALLLALCGPLAVLAHAAVDFPLHNPAVLFTATTVIVVVLRWAQFERAVRVGDHAAR